VILIIITATLIESAAWAARYIYVGSIQKFEEAFYFSLVTYSRLGYGDATFLELFHLPSMKLFSGKLVVLVQASTEAGNIDLTVTGKGLRKEMISLKSVN
jgi:hypothetical protein